MEIILYHTDCPKCKILQQKLDQKQIKYKSITNIEEIINLGYSSVPILQVNKTTYTFSEAIKLLKEW